jgi:uncharacterized protein (UPF0548 family)
LFLFNEPSPQRIARFLEAQRDAPFSYDEVGASREGAKAPTGYAVDHNRARLGRGRDTFERAVGTLHLAAPVRERLSTVDGQSHQSRASRSTKLLSHRPR